MHFYIINIIYFRTDAENILNVLEKVNQALEEAGDAQQKAGDAIQLANIDIAAAEDDLTQVNQKKKFIFSFKKKNKIFTRKI